VAKAKKAAQPQMTVVHLVRHGVTPSTGKVLPGRAKGLHLADAGVGQAERAAVRLGELATPPVAVYASPLERTRETAKPIGKILGLPVTIERGLLECDFGDWTGEQLSDLMKLPEWKTVQNAPSLFRFPNGESFLEMQSRAFSTVADLAARHKGTSIVAVSHADPIKAIVAMAAGTPIDQFQRLVISPCSITTLAFSDHGVLVLGVNATSSLTELVPS
jgi:probable phosphoglycerate mutase